jgi:hypothetical protein
LSASADLERVQNFENARNARNFRDFHARSGARVGA